MNKVIFLDIDGVLISTYPLWMSDKLDIDGYSKFNEINVDHFKKLLEEFPELKIIISSSRRIGKSIERLEQIFSFRGLTNKIIDKIPDPTTALLNRGLEISNYIFEKNISQFIVIDDDKSILIMDAHLLPNIILTEYEKGFDADCLELARTIIEKW